MLDLKWKRRHFVITWSLCYLSFNNFCAHSPFLPFCEPQAGDYEQLTSAYRNTEDLLLVRAGRLIDTPFNT